MSEQDTIDYIDEKMIILHQKKKIVTDAERTRI